MFKRYRLVKYKYKTSALIVFFKPVLRDISALCYEPKKRHDILSEPVAFRQGTDCNEGPKPLHWVYNTSGHIGQWSYTNALDWTHVH